MSLGAKKVVRLVSKALLVTLSEGASQFGAVQGRSLAPEASPLSAKHHFLPSREALEIFLVGLLSAFELDPEASAIALLYVDRFFARSPEVWPEDWRSLLLLALISASKVWDEVDFDNEQYAVMSKLFEGGDDIGIVDELERFFIQGLGYDISIETSALQELFLSLQQKLGQDDTHQLWLLLNFQPPQLVELEESANRRQMDLPEYLELLSAELEQRAGEAHHYDADAEADAEGEERERERDEEEDQHQDQHQDQDPDRAVRDIARINDHQLPWPSSARARAAQVAAS